MAENSVNSNYIGLRLKLILQNNILPLLIMIVFLRWKKFFITRKSLFQLLMFALILLSNSIGLIAQNKIEPNNIVLRKGEKRINLNKYNEYSVIFHKVSRGEDSISTEVYTNDLKFRKDTLYAKPTDITTFRLMDTLRPYNESRYYPNTTSTWLVIPAREIEYIKAKKQPLNKISSTVLSISYVTLLCSPFIAMSQNAEVSNFGVGLFLVSVPVLAVSFTTNAIWGKKKFRIDPKRTHKKVWELSK